MTKKYAHFSEKLSPVLRRILFYFYELNEEFYFSVIGLYCTAADLHVYFIRK
jgi:hypothetical protein